MPHGDSSHSCNSKKSRKRLWIFGLVAATSAIWILLRTGSKPSRISYPCQQAAVTNIGVFKTVLLAVIPSLATIRSTLNPLKPVGILAVLLVGSAFITSDSGIQALGFSLTQDYSEYDRVPLQLQGNIALASEHTSDVFLAQNVTGIDGDVGPAITSLLDMMETEGLYFYNTSSESSGLIERDDVVLLKVNGQWSYRGGTNTDLVKAVIEAIIDHPDGFIGEIIIADNGQGLGNLDWTYANAFNNSQAIEDVARSFQNHSVSTILWDDYRYNTVDDYDMGNFSEGYVRSSSWDADTEIYTSYPKFMTDTGLYVSFKNGIWDNATGFDSDRLKVINMPVLKSHFRYGVTGSIKNYMGVPQGYVVPLVDPGIPHEHFSIALGGMGTLMAETRMPILNILDMIWVNAHPLESSSLRGPWSRYSSASFTDIIGVSQDPVALDYWASKYILIPTAEYLEYIECSSLDPDYAPLSDQFYGSEEMDASFHDYLNRSRSILADAGFQVTMNTTEINVFVEESGGNETLPTSTGFQIDPLTLAVLIPVSALLIVGAAILIRRRR
ncbi:MAG: DUF362 domain-containing protein [Candidatus Thorarchaeota archaeon]